MTLSRRSFLGRVLLVLGGVVAAAKLGGAPKRAEASGTTADLAALQQAERDARPLYLARVGASPSADAIASAIMTGDANTAVSLLTALRPNEYEAVVSGASQTIRIRRISQIADEFNICPDSVSAMPYGMLGRAPRMREWMVHALGAQYTPTDYGGTWTFPRRLSTRLLFSEPRHVKHRG